MYRIVAMSQDRKTLMNRLRRYSETITDHVCKLMAFHDIRSDQIDHWIGEIAEKIVVCSKYTVKPKNRRMDPEVYYECVFGWFGDDEVDAKINLEECYQTHCVKDKFDPYPKFTIDTDLIRRTHLVCQDIGETMSVLLSETTGESADFEEVKSLLYDIFRKQIDI